MKHTLAYILASYLLIESVRQLLQSGYLIHWTVSISLLRKNGCSKKRNSAILFMGELPVFRAKKDLKILQPSFILL